jgi:hypothetical protein
MGWLDIPSDIVNGVTFISYERAERQRRIFYGRLRKGGML